MATALLESQEPAGFDGLAAAPELAASGLAAGGPEQPASIAAYYSLAFPGQTYYLQTLDVTIGRRLLPRGPAADGARDVDVDLGPLKSVSRLHAKITYDEDDERWVLDIYGRNGAWVDGAWSGPGCRVPLESRSQIQIASRSFSFILPPTDPPDDSPLTSSPTSTTRPRSPSPDATSLSPASSPGSAASPLPAAPPPLALAPDLVQRPKPKLVRKRAASSSASSASPAAPPPEPKPAAPPPPPPEPQLPYAPVTAVPAAPAPKAAKPKAGKAPKAKAAAHAQPTLPPAPAAVPAEPPAPAPLPPPPRPPPAPRIPGQPEPPKPAATLSQLCYRAITALGGRATLQGILGWIMDAYEWYRIHEGEKWESSVRHNLSSNAAFVKSRRTSDEPGKGAFWIVDPAHIEAFEVAESRPGKPVASGSGKTVSKKEGPPKVKKEQPAAAPAPAVHQPPPPPFAKVAVKGPPPLTTSKPLGSPFTSKPLLTSKPLASPFTSKPLPFKPAAPKGAGFVKQEAVPAALPPPPHGAYPPSALYPPPPGMVPGHPMVVGHPPPPMVVGHPPPPMAVSPHPPPAAVAPPPAAVAPPPPVAIAPAPAPPVPVPPPAAPVASSSTPTDGALHVPIVVGPLPASYVLAPGAEPPLIVLHEGTLVLAPKAFSNLTPAEISEFEKLGPQKALEALQGHMVKFLKEQMRLRGRGRGRGRGGPGRGGAGGRGGAPPPPPRTDTPMAVDDAAAAAQARPRSNSAEAADVPPAKRARLDA